MRWCECDRIVADFSYDIWKRIDIMLYTTGLCTVSIVGSHLECIVYWWKRVNNILWYDYWDIRSTYYLWGSIDYKTYGHYVVILITGMI